MKQLLLVCIMMITSLAYTQSTIDTNLNRSKDQLSTLKKDCIEVNFDILIKNHHVDSTYTVCFENKVTNVVTTLNVPIDKQGKFTAYLNYNQSYMISFSCNGYITKVIEFNTFNAPKMDWQANIAILMPQGKREPIFAGGFAYNPYMGEFIRTNRYLRN